jgi:hypothetical protein
LWDGKESDGQDLFSWDSGQFFLFILFFIVMLGGGTLWHLEKFLQCIMLEFTPSIILF